MSVKLTFDFTISELFPLINVNPIYKSSIQQILEEGIQYAILSRTDFKFEHIILGYMRYIEHLPQRTQKKLKLLPWYEDSNRYLYNSNLVNAKKTINKTRITADVIAFSNAFIQNASKLDLETFIYLLIFVNIKDLYNKHYVPYGMKLLPGESNQKSIISGLKTIYPLIRSSRSFDEFLKKSYPDYHKYIYCI